MHTLKKWNSKGRSIIKGSKARGFSKEGEALFSEDQTKENKYRFSRHNNEYDNYLEDEDRDWEDGFDDWASFEAWGD